jgi:peptidoglycan/LPS O-acetylase OafA/YrhL
MPLSRPAPGRIAGLDGLRAIAVTLVVVYHFLPDTLPAGFLGVDLFFALSGYLITRLLLTEITATGTLRLTAFYGRRVRRLAPSVIVLVLVAAVASALFWPDLRETLRGSVLSSFGYVTNWWLISTNQSYFMAEGRPPMLEHLWSLAIEEQFYLFWPLAILLVTSVGRRGRSGSGSGRDRMPWLAGLAALLTVGSAAMMAALSISGDVPYSTDSSRVYFGSDTHCMALFAGACAAAWAFRTPRQNVGAFHVIAGPRAMRAIRAAREPTTVAGVGFIVYASFRWNEYTSGIYRTGFLTFSLVAAAVVALVASDGSRVAGWLNVRILTAVGRRSYAIYLWHWPVDVVTRPGIDIHAPALVVLLLRVTLTGALGCASYRWVEVGLRSRWTREGLFTSGSDPAALVRSPGVMLGAPIAAALLLVSTVPAGENQAESAVSASSSAASTSVASAADRPQSPPAHQSRMIASPGSQSPRSTAHNQQLSCLTSPAHGPGASLSSSAVAFGDSVMLGAAWGLRSRLPGLTIHATVGLLPRPILAEVRAMRGSHRPPIVIIHIGDNGFIPPDDLSSALDSLRGAARVVLVTAKVPRDWQDAADRVLRQIAARYPNVSVADWQAESQSHDDWFVSDGVHLTSPGIAAFSACIASAVTQSG